jgi:hypothetical protein
LLPWLLERQSRSYVCVPSCFYLALEKTVQPLEQPLELLPQHSQEETI